MPVSLMVCGLPLALSEIEMDPLTLPVAVGPNVTLIVHEAPGASAVGEIGQLLFSENGVGGVGAVMLPIRRLAVPEFLR